MKRKKAALYDPYLDTLGGGERYVLSIMKTLEEAGYDVDIFWKSDLSKDIFSRLKINFHPDSFKTRLLLSENYLEKMWNLRPYDIFLYITDGSYILSGAKKNFVYCMVPQKNLYNMNLVNRIKTINTKFITHSDFTKNTLQSWGIETDRLYPYIDDVFINGESGVKENIILSVGRFFPHLHSKRHDIVIELFKKLKENGSKFKDFKLVLAGGLKPEDSDYFHKLKKISGNDESISFFPNLPFDELISIYKKSRFYWHCAGWGIDDQKNPEMVEHLGITPLEAMASGCVTFVYSSGGVKELVKDGVTGYTFKTSEDLIEKMARVTSDTILEENVKLAGKEYLQEKFSRAEFRRNVQSIFIE